MLSHCDPPALAFCLLVHLPAVLRDWQALDHFVAMVQGILLFEDPAPTVVGIAGCCSVASVASRFQFMRAPLRQVAAKALAATPLGLRLSHGPALRTRACASPPVFLGVHLAGN